MFIQEAILLTNDNAPAVAMTLTAYPVEELLQENAHLLTLSGSVVLCSSFDSDAGMRFVEYVVHESLYKANNSNFDQLNDKTYVPVKNI